MDDSPEDVFQQLLIELQSHDNDVSREAAFRLSKIADNRSIEPLLDYYSSPEHNPEGHLLHLRESRTKRRKGLKEIFKRQRKLSKLGKKLEHDHQKLKNEREETVSKNPGLWEKERWDELIQSMEDRNPPITTHKEELCKDCSSYSLVDRLRMSIGERIFSIYQSRNYFAKFGDHDFCINCLKKRHSWWKLKKRQEKRSSNNKQLWDKYPNRTDSLEKDPSVSESEKHIKSSCIRCGAEISSNRAVVKATKMAVYTPATTWVGMTIGMAFGGIPGLFLGGLMGGAGGVGKALEDKSVCSDCKHK
mgnify:FL=1|tara:strand:- start:28 stop:939 length:912 start_codon:yes stop_codon:yes gene_type:complete